MTMSAGVTVGVLVGLSGLAWWVHRRWGDQGAYLSEAARRDLERRAARVGIDGPVWSWPVMRDESDDAT